MLTLTYLALACVVVAAIAHTGERFDLHPWRFHIVITFSCFPMLNLEMKWYFPRFLAGSGHAHLHLACWYCFDVGIFYHARQVGAPASASPTSGDPVAGGG